MFWLILGVVLLIFGLTTWIVLIATNFKINDAWIGIAVVALFFGLTLTIGCVCEYVDNDDFINGIQLQKEYIEQYIEANPEATENFVYIMDIVSSNQELAMKQARRMKYGAVFSLIPREILDITPIGVP